MRISNGGRRRKEKTKGKLRGRIMVGCYRKLSSGRESEKNYTHTYIYIYIYIYIHTHTWHDTRARAYIYIYICIYSYICIFSHRRNAFGKSTKKRWNMSGDSTPSGGEIKTGAERTREIERQKERETARIQISEGKLLPFTGIIWDFQSDVIAEYTLVALGETDGRRWPCSSPLRTLRSLHVSHSTQATTPPIMDLLIFSRY